MSRFFSFFLLLLAIGCTKPALKSDSSFEKQGNADEALADLTIAATSTPATASLEGNIVSNVRCTGPNLCYKLEEFEVKETAPRAFEIRAKGTVPGQSAVCAQAIYVVDTTVSIKPATTGQYTLRFYNGTTLFKTETVQVN